MRTKEDLIAAVQALAKERGVRRLARSEFQRATGTSNRQVFRHFAGWADLCKAAGIEALGRNARLNNDIVYDAMRTTFIECGGIVPQMKFLAKFPHSRTVLIRRFGSWPKAISEFATWAAENAPDFPYLEALTARVRGEPPVSPWQVVGARPYGDPVGFRGLLCAPVNELGVVFAFGMVAAELGYALEAITDAFPDCIAKRHVRGGRWQSVRIELEFKSRNFLDHGHAPEGCDMIVCWDHDWPDCPVEVLELRSAIAGLRGAATRAPAK